MWSYDKKLQYPVKVKTPSPKMAKIVMTQLGGPDGETGAAMRYLHQRYACPYGEITGVLTDVGTDVAKWAKKQRPVLMNETLRGLNLVFN